MSDYVTVNRLSLVQLLSEERKQQAHLKKIAELKHRSGIDNSKPAHFPHTHNFTTQLMEKHREVARENYAMSKKLIDIMQSKTVYPPPPFHPTSTNRHRHQALNLSQNNADYL